MPKTVPLHEVTFQSLDVKELKGQEGRAEKLKVVLLNQAETKIRGQSKMVLLLLI